MKSVIAMSSLLTLALVAGCVAPKQPPSPPRQAPTSPRPVSPPPPPPTDWRDIPLTPGDWTYRDSGGMARAEYGPVGAEPNFIISCDKSVREVGLSRLGNTSGNLMTVRTSFGARNFSLSVRPQPVPYVYVALRSSDAFLDSIAFSRGRFTVEVPGMPMLVIPAWAEPARVIEDCRG